MTDITLFGLFLLIIILSFIFKNKIWKKLIFTYDEEELNKLFLKIGLFLVFVGILVVVIGYLTNYIPYESFENGYHYRDEVAIIATVFIMIGSCLSLYGGLYKARKIAHEEGWDKQP